MTEKNPRKQQVFQETLFKEGVSRADNRQKKKHAVMFCDGASSGNPGSSGIGVVIDVFEEGHDVGEKETHKISDYIGIATNNVAEYTALIEGLKKAGLLGIKRIRIFLDSELLVRQIKGVYKVRNENLIPLWKQVMKLLHGFDEYTVTHVRREQNADADRLAREGSKKKSFLH